MNNRLLYIAFAAFLISIVFPCAAQSENENGQTLSKEDMKMVTQLRLEIDEAYKRIIDAGTLKPKNDITEIVLRYIPIGTSFDDAEQVLRSAGFKVGPRPGTSAPGTFPWRYDVTASIDPYSRKAFPSKVYVDVRLSPRTPNDYDKVIKIEAAIGRADL